MNDFLLPSDIEEIVHSLGPELISEFAGRRILITGARGFLGRYFTDTFVGMNGILASMGKDPCEVVALDNMITAGDAGAGVRPDKNVAFVKHDVIKPFYPERPVDFIIHAAGIASPYYYRKYPLETLEVSTTGLKNALELARANPGSRLCFFSSSEIYGDPSPANVPTQESYRGNVSCLGPRSCYDESKRLGETLVRIYHEQHGVHGTIIRPFNCLTADQKVLYQKDGETYFETFEECYSRTGGDPTGVSVPSFDPNDLSIRVVPVSAVMRRLASEDVYTVRTKWGRSVTVTGDHVMFRRIDGRIQEVSARDVSVGDELSICRSLNIDVVDLEPFRISDRIPNEHLSFRSSMTRDVVGARPNYLRQAYLSLGGDSRMFSAKCQKWMKNDRLPSTVFIEAAIPHTDSEEICYRSSDNFVKNRVTDVNGLLWLLGYTLADGHISYVDGSYCLVYADKHVKYLDMVRDLLSSLFGLSPSVYSRNSVAPTMVIHSKVLVELFKALGFGGSNEDKRVPGWILALPPDRISKFLHGFWCGDGNHDAKTTGEYMLFYNSNRDVISGINALLLRLGHVGSVYEFQSKPRADSPYFTAYRIELHGVQGVSVEDLHSVRSPGSRDVEFARVTSMDRSAYEGYVYDFTVPETANFLAGDLGVMVHNCYGPGMQKSDYRVLPNFGARILEDKPLQIYGTGDQTRTFCYVTDAIRGFLQVLVRGVPGEPYNIGNPQPEVSMRELAARIGSVLGREVRYDVVDYPDSYPADEPNRRCPDIRKAAAQVGYSPFVSLDDGLRRFFHWASKAYVGK
jgi:UDP-glucuronate decarboxylase